MNMLQCHFTAKIADVVVDINTVSSRTCILCRDYLTDDKPDFSISVTEEDIQYEFAQIGNNRNSHNEIYIETIAAYRKIVEKVAEYNTFLIHGAVIAKDENAYIFSAPSGTGKTTHAKLWQENLKDAYILNGDKPLVKVSDSKVLVYGTPWCGFEHYGRNAKSTLKAIVFMQRSDNNSIERLEFSKAYPLLLQHTYLPKDAEKAKKIISLTSQLYGKVSFYRFMCNNYKNDCFEVAYSALTNERI